MLVALACAACHPKTKPADAGAPPSAPASCASIVASWDAVVAAGARCTTDADCECVSGGVSPKTPCGAVVDHASAKRLEPLRAAFESDRCDALMCPAEICRPVCRAGTCQNAP